MIVVVRIELDRMLVSRNRSRQIEALAESLGKRIMLEGPTIGGEGRR